MEQKKYNKIERKINEDFLQDGVNILIQEKIDGANASFRKDEDGNLRVFSRNKELSQEENLGGFYDWAIENINPKDLNPDTVYFGEWTNKHKIDYGKYLKKFFLFDVYVDSETTKQYMPLSFVEYWADKLKVSLVPVFYKGEFKSIDHLMSFVGKTALEGKIGDEVQGEGIVIKRYEYLDRFGLQKHFKIVTNKFSEKKQGETKNKNNATPESIFVNEFATEARVIKNFFKLFDESVIVGEADKVEYKDLGTIMKNLVPAVRDDLLEEELDSFKSEEPINLKNVNKSLGTLCSQYIRKFIDEKNKKELEEKLK